MGKHIGAILEGPTHAGYRQAVEHYIKQLTSKQMPAAVLVCMIYFPSEHQTPSWCSSALGRMGYNSRPQLLQSAIQQMFTIATQNVSIPGTKVIPVPLFEKLEGKTRSDYLHRVEPSATGGAKLAEFILQHVALAPDGTYGEKRARKEEELEARTGGIQAACLKINDAPAMLSVVKTKGEIRKREIARID